MKTEHLFLSSPAVPVSVLVPARWREAFPDGTVHEMAALLSRLRAQPATANLVWLSSADAQWPAQLRQILQTRPDARVLLLSNAPDEQEGLRAINSGVRGYAHAHGVPMQLQEVALVAEHGGMWVGPELLRRLVGSTYAALAGRRRADAGTLPAGQDWDGLSAREREVARAVSAGHSNKEVATLLHISERTVKAHLSAVFEKLGVRDRLQLVLRLSAAVESERPPELVRKP
jgi:DNA-binding NarL/FixJ family response regulator